MTETEKNQKQGNTTKHVFAPNNYIAYGSNLNVEQMAYRCPSSAPIGSGEILNYALIFRGSQSGNYLTIEPKPGASVPVVIWKIAKRDEENLDRYEGFPRFYEKQTFRIRMRDFRDGRVKTVEAMAYIMAPGHRAGLPSSQYMHVCMDGYKTFGLDVHALEEALQHTQLAIDNEETEDEEVTKYYGED